MKTENEMTIQEFNEMKKFNADLKKWFDNPTKTQTLSLKAIQK